MWTKSLVHTHVDKSIQILKNIPYGTYRTDNKCAINLPLILS